MRLSSLRGKQGILNAAVVAIATTRTNLFRLLFHLVLCALRGSRRLFRIFIFVALYCYQQPITFPAASIPRLRLSLTLPGGNYRGYYSSICCRKTQETVPALGQGRKPLRSLRRAAWNVTMLLLLLLLRVCGRDGGVAWGGVWTTASSTWRLTAGTPTQVYYNDVLSRRAVGLCPRGGGGRHVVSFFVVSCHVRTGARVGWRC